MTEEIKTQNEQKNTVATVGMRLSILWLIALITVLFAWIWLPLLCIWFILWIIGLFYKPRARARVAICIPLVVFIAIASVICYIWSSVRTPAESFVDWIKVEFENIDGESFDNDKFNEITNEEFNNIVSSMTEEDFKQLLENSEWSNTLEKGSYVIFGLLQQGFEKSLERYNSEVSEIVKDVDNDEVVDQDEEPQDTEVEESNEPEETGEENVNSVEVFTQSEQNDIEQILGILE